MSLLLKYIFKTATLLLFVVFCFSCASMLKSSIKDDGKQIPPDFGKEDVTILVVKKGKRSYDKYLEKNFSQNYFGKYVYVLQDEIITNKLYADKQKYQYVFEEDLDVRINTSAGNNMGSVSKIAKFQITDRITGKVYKTKSGTGSFSEWMRYYIQALEKARQKNKSTT